MRSLSSVWWFFLKQYQRSLFILSWSFDHLIWAEEKKDIARCKSLMRGIFVTALQSGNPAHMDACNPCWDLCQFCFYQRGTMSSCAACVGTPCLELKEKCQYCVGGQSLSWGGCTIIGLKSPRFVQLTRLPIKPSFYSIWWDVQPIMGFFLF